MDVLLAPGAEDNGLCTMLAALIRQNLEARPRKRGVFRALWGTVAIVAEDAEVAVTLRFQGGKATLYGGIVGVPDVTIRGTSDVIVGLSNVPLSVRFALPFAGDREGRRAARAVMGWMRDGSLQVHGAFAHPWLLWQLTRVMSVNG